VHYVYGPVPSRRLGFSLGVDIVPYKTCILDSIYCQLGRTLRKTIRRKSYPQIDAVCREVREALGAYERIDYITFSGSGEPTLNSDIGVLINEIKKMTSIPVVVVTNGTSLFREEVQKDLEKADIVMPSLDAASQEMFERINRPYGSLKIGTVIDGLATFKRRYQGKMWLEIMLVQGLNDSPNALPSFKKAISQIRPDKIYLNTVVRPPAEAYAKPLSGDNLSGDKMMSVRSYLDGQCDVIAEFHEHTDGQAKNVEEAIVEMAKRRPVTLRDIARVVGASEVNAEKLVSTLLESGMLAERLYKGEKYFSYLAKTPRT